MPKFDAYDALNVNLASLEAFVIASEHSSLAKAARSCGVGVDTFRKRIDAVERWADVVLLQRRPDILLTPDGIRLLPLAKRACLLVREFQDDRSPEQRRNFVIGKMRKLPNGSVRRRTVGSKTFVEID